MTIASRIDMEFASLELQLKEARVEIERLKAEREKLRELFHDHYWDSLMQWRDLILKHIDAVLEMAALKDTKSDEPPPPPEDKRGVSRYGW
jgi:hypothetical protein